MRGIVLMWTVSRLSCKCVSIALIPTQKCTRSSLEKKNYWMQPGKNRSIADRQSTILVSTLIFWFHWWATCNIYNIILLGWKQCRFWKVDNYVVALLLFVSAGCKKAQGSGGLEAMMTEGLWILSCYRGWMWSCLKTGLLHTHIHWRHVKKDWSTLEMLYFLSSWMYFFFFKSILLFT